MTVHLQMSPVEEPTEANEPPVPLVPFLDRMLDPDEAAEWLGMNRRELDEKRRKKQIPAIELGQRTVRYHPRTVIEFFTPATPKR